VANGTTLSPPSELRTSVGTGRPSERGLYPFGIILFIYPQDLRCKDIYIYYLYVLLAVVLRIIEKLTYKPHFRRENRSYKTYPKHVRPRNEQQNVLVAGGYTVQG
jgi:hypothetical protein